MKKLAAIYPYLIVLFGFILISYAYNPELLKGKIVNQSDISSWEGMAHEIIEHNEAHPDDKTLWTNSMFGGMPATSISAEHPGDYTEPVYNFLFLGERPASYMVISLIGGLLLFLAFGANIWLAAIGAIAITFCSYNMQIIQVGHNAKMAAIAFMPWVLGAFVYAYRRNALWGAILFGFALSFQIKTNHPQITYYLAFIVLGYAIAELCGAIKNKAFPKFFRTSLIVLVAGLLGIATNATRLIPTYEYAKYTMRGGSELTKDKDVQTGDGLKIDYATAWSYGIEETPNLLIPNFNGGASQGELGRDSHTYKVLNGKYQGANQLIKQMPLYWGPQPFTAGPMYLGALSVFLFALGLALIKDRYKWWIVGVSVLALFLSWGSHFMWFSEIFFKYAPLYNKFRTVSMALVVLQITVPVMGVLAVKELLDMGADQKKKVQKSFAIALGFTAGISLLFALFPGLAGDFVGRADDQFPSDIAAALVDDRKALLRGDAIRSLIFILLGAVALWFTYLKRLKSVYGLAIIGVLMLVDLWSVDKRYLNDSHYIRRQEYKNIFAERPVDKIIHQDSDPYYRVLDLSVNTFNDSYVSYHHKTIGGYSPAKLQRYQDLIQYYITPELGSVVDELNAAMANATTVEDLERGIGYHKMLSMLNTKYIIFDGNTAPVVYPYPMGNCWLVQDVYMASSADEEIETIALIDPAKQVILSAKDGAVAQVSLDGESKFTGDGTIALSHYAPNELRYKFSSDAAQLAVFSEIYYPAGWKAYIDGEEAPILKADYTFRGLAIPSGEHDIVFRFDPQSFHLGANISRAASLLLWLALVGVAVAGYLHRRRKVS